MDFSRLKKPVVQLPTKDEEKILRLISAKYKNKQITLRFYENLPLGGKLELRLHGEQNLSLVFNKWKEAKDKIVNLKIKNNVRLP